MTEARLEVDPHSQSVTLELHIDLLRTAGSTDAYLALAEGITDPKHAETWRQLADAIDLRQGDQSIPLRFASARPPSPFDPPAFEDPFRWPKVWVVLIGEGFNANLPLTVSFGRTFLFEEPIALTITDESRRLSRWLVTSQVSPRFVGSHAIEAGSARSLSERLDPLATTLRAGFLHIVPAGADHLMFVLALLLLCRSVRSVVLLVTAFTLGHSLSLAVAGFRLVSVPEVLVESFILLSIAVYALQALSSRTEAKSGQFVAVLLVGVLHGLGFAEAFAQLQWAQSPALHLLFFNVGIELGQLLFVLVAYPLIARYRDSIQRPIALSLCVIALALLAYRFVP